MRESILYIGCATLLALGVATPVTAQTVGTAGVPSGLGLAGDAAAVSISGSYGPERSKTDKTRLDASGSVLAGFGDPVVGFGVHGGINVTSFRNFGASGYFSLGVHKMFQTSEAGIYSVALNIGHLAPWGDAKNEDESFSLVGTYLTSVVGRLAMFTLGAATDTNAYRDLDGVVGVGIGLSKNVAVSVGQVGHRTAVGLTLSPAMFGGNSVSVSVNRDHYRNENKLVVDLGRAFRF